jgi:hypothetical protein
MTKQEWNYVEIIFSADIMHLRPDGAFLRPGGTGCGADHAGGFGGQAA